MSKRNEDINNVGDLIRFLCSCATTDDATFFASTLDDMVAEYDKKSKEDGPAIKLASDD